MPGKVRTGLELDTPVYRFVQLPHFMDEIRSHTLHLSLPRRWEDPFENMLESCAIDWRSSKGIRQEMLASKRLPMFAQCWSATQESDALWRAYSWYEREPTLDRNRHPGREGVQVRSTPRKLIAALSAWAGDRANDTCYIGKVEYMPEEAVAQRVADDVGRNGPGAFGGAEGHVDSIMFKRDAFAHEDEVRLVYVDLDRDHPSATSIRVPFEPAQLFDEVVFEPRLLSFERIERENLAKGSGIPEAIIRQSMRYQRTLWQILVDDPNDPPANGQQG